MGACLLQCLNHVRALSRTVAPADVDAGPDPVDRIVSPHSRRLSLLRSALFKDLHSLDYSSGQIEMLLLQNSPNVKSFVPLHGGDLTITVHTH